ncbi:MAG: hypothetical protein ACRDTG_28375 [Pseudonocardiaceae bacterium]
MRSSDLRVRLTGGFAVAAARTRFAGQPAAGMVSAFDHAQIRSCLELVGDARRGSLGDLRVESALAELHELLAANRAILLGVLFGSDPLIAEFPPVEGPLTNEVFDHWFQLCWLAEASWRVVTGELVGPEFAPGDSELLYSLAARLRFHVLSEPMRYRAARTNPWLPAAEEQGAGPHGRIGRVFGSQSWNLLVARCRQARQNWLSCLNRYQSHPLLAIARPGEFEAELSWLVFRRRHGGEPLGLSGKPLRDSAPLTTEDQALIEDAADRHLLPRFRLLGVAALALHADGSFFRAARILVAVGAVLALGVAILLAAQLRIHTATWAVAGCYLLIGIGCLFFGPLWTMPWLLRLPAACALGLAVLMTLPPDWWQTPRVGFAAGVALACAAFGYLIVEARNHGVALGAALGRSAGVAVTGAVHGLLVSLIGLVAIAPAFIDKGDELAAVWRTPGDYGQAGMILVLSTCWCLAVGVFSQILWDDRPVTARLAHLHWRSERPT